MKEERTRSLVFLNVSTSQDWLGSTILDEDDAFQPEKYGWRVIRILKMTESGKHNRLQHSCPLLQYTVYSRLACYLGHVPIMEPGAFGQLRVVGAIAGILCDAI